jgi:hypothetical protein
LIKPIDFGLNLYRLGALKTLDFIMNLFLTVPTRYWVISCIGSVWFAMGALDYVRITYKIPAYMQAMPEDLQFWLDQRPVWITSVWAISVWSALFGSFLLLLRHRPAPGLSVLLLVSFLIVVHWAYLSEAANMAHIQFTITHIFDVLILFSLIFFITFCRRYIQTGVLR